MPRPQGRRKPGWCVKEQREDVQRGRPDCFPVCFQVGWFPSNYVEEDYSEYC